MGQLRVYIAMSLDGFIADANGGVGFLDKYSHDGFEEFFEQIGTLVIGRRTLDQVAGFGPWPYGDRQTIVLSNRELPAIPGADLSRVTGDVHTVSDRLAKEKGDAWIVGGPHVIHQFRTTIGIDLWHIFVVPELLGSGVRLFEDDSHPNGLQLIGTQSFEAGIVGLQYKTN